MKQSLLTILRDKKTPTENFRKTTHQLSSLLASEMAALLKEKDKRIKTPFEKIHGLQIAESIVLIPILRSGMALLPAFLDIFDNAKVGILGIKRDEETAIPIQYYTNIPTISLDDQVIILDPMIATGGTAKVAIETAQKSGASQEKIHFISLVGAKETLEKLKKSFPSITFHVVAPEESLSDFWLVPGLGDFGDRFFKTP